MTQVTESVLRIYFHASWNPKTKKAGGAFMLTRIGNEGNIERSGWSSGMVMQSQQAMELMVLNKAFDRISKRELADRPIAVYTTSNYVIRSIDEWMVKWKKQSWRGGNNKLVKNAEQLLQLDTWNKQFKPAWHLIKDAGAHPESIEVKEKSTRCMNAV
ncbi:RNase H family protein [Salinimonas lutimaris]|uniref:RNase H family protein n=1 Tax=Salinimonas lutimaris TaxID=914153 RepID=UPI0010BFD7F3|nr:RNase H family protein [Salinimonas lutimaris]